MKHSIIRERLEILWDITDLILCLVEDAPCTGSYSDLTIQIWSESHDKCCSLQSLLLLHGLHSNLLCFLQSKELSTATVALHVKVKPPFLSLGDTGESTSLVIKAKSWVSTSPKFQVPCCLLWSVRLPLHLLGFCAPFTLPYTPLSFSYEMFCWGAELHKALIKSCFMGLLW